MSGRAACGLNACPVDKMTGNCLHDACLKGLLQRNCLSESCAWKVFAHTYALTYAGDSDGMQLIVIA